MITTKPFEMMSYESEKIPYNFGVDPDQEADPGTIMIFFYISQGIMCKYI